jgi:hypothetical protein
MGFTPEARTGSVSSINIRTHTELALESGTASTTMDSCIRYSTANLRSIYNIQRRIGGLQSKHHHDLGTRASRHYRASRREAAAGRQEEDCQENQNSSLHDFQFSGLGDLLASMGNGTFDTFSLKIRARLKAYSDV